MNDNHNQIKKIRPLRCPLTPYQLFSPVSTVFLDNLTHEEQLLGLYKLFNDFITEYNKIIEVVAEVQQLIQDVPEQIAALQEAMDLLQQNVIQRLLEIAAAVKQGDENTLAQANKYTDDQIAQIKNSGFGGYMYGGLTAAEYDALQWTATDYEAMDWTAIEYDTRAKYVLYGEDGTIYLKYAETLTAEPGANLFELANPPVKLGRRYILEISLGNFTGGTDGVAHLELVGETTTGSTNPINIPDCGSASIAFVPTTAAPTAVRVSASDTAITANNAFIKIKPLGEI